jgi:ubiquitin
LLILGSVALGFLAFDLTRGKIDTWLAVSATATPSPSASASTAATAAAVPTSASPTPTASSTASASPVASPSSPTTSDVTPTAASVSLRILNGTTITGAAAKSKDLLAKAGFNVKSVGNAKTQNYSSTFVYYQAGKQAQANLVQQTLKDTYSVTLQESPLAQPDDVLIVIGKK